MKNDIHFSSRMMTFAGGMMTLSATLMILCGRIDIGGCFLAAASCMFLSAYHLRLSEKKKENKEESNHDQETL